MQIQTTEMELTARVWDELFTLMSYPEFTQYPLSYQIGIYAVNREWTTVNALTEHMARTYVLPDAPRVQLELLRNRLVELLSHP